MGRLEGSMWRLEGGMGALGYVGLRRGILCWQHFNGLNGSSVYSFPVDTSDVYHGVTLSSPQKI